MTNMEKVAMLTSLVKGDVVPPDEETLTAYLNIAEQEIISWRYSLSNVSGVTAVPPEYEMTQVFAVLAGLTTSGAEGETAHSENGISRTFKHADMIAYIRAHVPPMCKVV